MNIFVLKWSKIAAQKKSFFLLLILPWSTLLWHWCYYPHRSRDALSPVCGIFFSKAINKCKILNNPRTSRWAFWKKAERDVFGFLITQFLNHFWKKTCVLLFKDFKGKQNFSESALFHREMVGLTNFRPATTVCIVNVMISINKYLSKVFRISFLWIVEGHHSVDH